MRINKYFEESEFACNDVDKTSAPFIDDELVDVLTDVRVHFGKPVTITSSYRTPVYNKSVGGAEHSRHLYLDDGAAADIQVKDTSPVDVALYLKKKYPDTYGIGCYNEFVHIDTRSSKARW